MRPAQMADLDSLFALWTNTEARRFLWDDRVIALDEANSTLERCLALNGRGLGLWMLERRTPASILGCAGLLPVNAPMQQADARLADLIEPLVALDPPAWNQGYAHEALTALMTYAHEELGLDTLAGVCDIPNEASDRMLRRVGFAPLGECAGPRYRMRTYLWHA